jgi:hypothetical protein
METFVVRVAVTEQRDETGRGGDALHGSVEHIRKGEAIPFADGDQLVAIIRRAIGRTSTGVAGADGTGGVDREQ